MVGSIKSMDSASEFNFDLERERLISWVSAQPSGLIREKYFARIADEIAKKILTTTQNSVTTVFLLHWLIDGNLRKIDLHYLLDLVHENLCLTNFDNRLKSIGIQDNAYTIALDHKNYLYYAFFEYYWARLGKVLRMVRFISHSPSVFSKYEREAIEKLSWLLFYNKYQQIEQKYIWLHIPFVTDHQFRFNRSLIPGQTDRSFRC